MDWRHNRGSTCVCDRSNIHQDIIRNTLLAQNSDIERSAKVNERSTDGVEMGAAHPSAIYTIPTDELCAECGKNGIFNTFAPIHTATHRES